MPIAVDIDVMLARRKTSVGGSGRTRTPDSATKGGRVCLWMAVGRLRI